MHITQVILTQHKAKTDDGRTDLLYRVAKLIGSVSFYIERSPSYPRSRKVHVGDILSEAEAELLEDNRRLKVTVTEKAAEKPLGS